MSQAEWKLIADFIDLKWESFLQFAADAGLDEDAAEELAYELEAGAAP